MTPTSTLANPGTPTSSSAASCQPRSGCCQGGGAASNTTAHGDASTNHDGAAPALTACRQPALPAAFQGLPDNARLWLYVFERDLSASEVTRAQSALNAFATAWNSHGSAVSGAATVLDYRIVALAATLDSGVSGCSIDSSTRAIKAICADLGVDALRTFNMHYRDAAGTVHTVSRPVFQQRLRAGQVTASTEVWYAALTSLGEYRDGQFAQPLSRSPFAAYLAAAVTPA